jgi:putative membrane protein
MISRTPNGADNTPYCGPVIGPEGLWSAWNLDPVLISALGAAALVFIVYRQRYGAERLRDRAVSLALAAAFVAFVSPLCAATVSLFSARTAHHLVLLCVLAPALAVGIRWRVLPAGVAFALVAGVLLLWHVPRIYDAAWNSVAVYWLLQAAMLASGWWFWSSVLHPAQQSDDWLTHGLLVGGLASVMGMIGAVLTFAPNILYPQHLVGAEAFGMGALADQQLAGLVMWVPGFLPVAGVAFWMLQRGWKNGFAT